jgi:hypothetical protein
MTFQEWFAWRIKGGSAPQIATDLVCGIMADIFEQCRGDAQAATGVFKAQAAPAQLIAMLEADPELWVLAKEHIEGRLVKLRQEYDEWLKKAG